MNSISDKYDGYYKNVDTGTDAITQLHFFRSGDGVLVNAWGRCHPEDCEWGPAPLFILDASDTPEFRTQAFASWGTSYCHFTATNFGLNCSQFATHSIPKRFGYRIDMEFVPGQTDKFLNCDPLLDYRAMWDGTEPGWKLVRFNQPVFIVEFHFDESGPTKMEFATLKEFRDNPFDDDETWWNALRDCTGSGLPKPLTEDRLRLLHTHQIAHQLDLTIRAIADGDYLYLSPDGNYGTWYVHPEYHSAVVKKMLDSEFQIETRAEP